MTTFSLSRGMRIGLPSVVLSLWCGLFLWRLFKTQVIDSEYYHELASANTAREKITPPTRGIIRMKGGLVVACDAPRYDLNIKTGKLTLQTVTPAQVHNLVAHGLSDERPELRDELIGQLAADEPFVQELAQLLGQDKQAIARSLLSALEAVERRWVNGSTAQPFLLGIDRDRWLVVKQRTEDPFTPPVSNWQAIEASLGSERLYPCGTLAAAVIGTVKTLGGSEYEQLERSGLAITQYDARQKWYAAKLAKLTPEQVVELGTAFGSLEIPPRPPAYIDEAVHLLRESRAALETPNAATTIAIGNTSYDATAPAASRDLLLAALNLSALTRFADEPLMLDLSDGEKTWVGADGYGLMHRLLPQNTVGSMGVELSHNDELRGRHQFTVETRMAAVAKSGNGEIQDAQAGATAIPASPSPAAPAASTDNSGFELIQGGDIQLTLDPVWQRAAERALAEDQKEGVVIAMDVNTGAILCLAMWPTFDPTAFSEHRNEEVQNYMKDPGAPLLNRAISGLYAPGSIMKPIVSLGAIDKEAVSSQFNIFCDGSVRNSTGKHMIGCEVPHGQTGFEHALKKSCNCFYHFVAQKWGIDGLTAWLREAGLGSRTGIDLPFENPGFIPTPEWKHDTYGEKWLGIETSHVAIGQGSVQITPLQAVTMMAIVANGGKVLHPHVVDQPGADEIVRDLHLKPEAVRLVHEGLRQCVNEIGGTAYRTFHKEPLGVEVAGKTGTADVKLHGEPRVNSWFAGYAPASKPEVVFVAVVPYAPPGSAGGLVAGSLMQRTIKEVYAAKKSMNAE